MDAASYNLIIEDDEGRRSVVPIDLGEISIGRFEGNAIRLKERNVSRRHARLVKEDEAVFAEDLGSFNGVWVNGDRITGRRELFDGDLIKIGDFHIELRGEGLQKRRDDTTQKTPTPRDSTISDGSEVTKPGTPMKAVELADPLAPQLASEEPTAPHVPPVDKAFHTMPTEPLLASDLETLTEPSRPEPPPLEGRLETPEIVDLDPVDASEEQSTEPLVTAGPWPKLVCVTAPFAGREFEITRPEMVIGRTQENEICVPHRSVSRHHAKLEVSGARSKIVDLGSANGTFVNDEEYAQTELGRGDLIELGHVRFRFVPAGLTYDFTPEEVRVIEGARRDSTHGRSRETVWVTAIITRPALSLVVMGLVVAAVVGGAAWFLGSRGADGVMDPKLSAISPNAIPEADGALQRDAADADRLFQQAHSALSDQQWKRAAALAGAALAVDAGHEAAGDVLRQAELESTAQHDYAQAMASVERSEWDDAWNSLQQVPEQSVYGPRAAKVMDRVRGALVTARLTAAQAAIKGEEWEKARELVDEVAGLDAERPEIADLRAAIAKGDSAAKQPSRARPRSSRPRSQTVKPKSSPGPGATPKAPSAAFSEGAKELYLEGARLLQANQFQKAVESFNRCVLADKRFSLCYRALGIAYARLGNGPKAARYYRLYLKVDPAAPDADRVRKFLQHYEAAPRP